MQESCDVQGEVSKEGGVCSTASPGALDGLGVGLCTLIVPLDDLEGPVYG